MTRRNLRKDNATTGTLHLTNNNNNNNTNTDDG
eukprot:CAMPEP_0172303796 /NCGR_PEP_ID=MMETSP1058-20130122/5314_1 /TAXON_ID=83371 /ORGANISM="Detonula confervacea, Strain CCMP 353" /LENGTH=32 /DNA_ID= /DNA_START= /DNA_END= /DNA_ORIENTATION=